ncbi:MAG: hypothetical protein KKC55_13835, partial [Gammaproteobacteria bacterium]|nr:hypothetical protein [Gammaproteobacteria bacterium]
GERDVSACLYNINSDELVRTVEGLFEQKETIMRTVREYFPGEYHKDYDPAESPFSVDEKNMTKIHQPFHNDESYVAKMQVERAEWLIGKCITAKGVLDIG